VIVLDASAAVEVLGDTPAGREILGRLTDERVLHAPHILDLEVVSAFRRQSALGTIGRERIAQALALYGKMRIMRYPHYPYIDRIWALRHNFSAYDACYLALVESLGATLITRDKALASARLRRGNIELI